MVAGRADAAAILDGLREYGDEADLPSQTWRIREVARAHGDCTESRMRGGRARNPTVGGA